MRKPSTIELIEAKPWEWASRLCAQFPWLKRLVIGEGYPARIYAVTHTHADDIAWQEAPGTKGRIPRNYQGAAGLAVPSESWRNQRMQFESPVYAGAFAVGNTVLVTEIPDDEVAAAMKRTDLGHVDTIFRVGDGNLRCAVGVHDRAEKIFAVNPDVQPPHLFPAAEIAQRYPNAVLL